MKVITRRATLLAGDRSRGAISPARILSESRSSRIVCIGTYSILCDFGKLATRFRLGTAAQKL